MSLSVDAPPFVPLYPSNLSSDRNSFLYHAQPFLSPFDLSLLSDITSEWNRSISLSECLELWKSCKRQDTSSPLTSNSLHVLSFNVRGFNLRHQEVLLLANTYQLDILVLLETGWVDFGYCSLLFPNHRIFLQRGENANGGVCILIRNDLKVSRIQCDIPNVCIVDLLLKDPVRIIGIYAPESRSWTWDHLSQLITDKCVLFGDFNVDLEKDNSKAEGLLKWMDTHDLAPFLPSCATSLRSERKIDYALAAGITVLIQAYNGDTTSDHKPILAMIPTISLGRQIARTTHWNVFSMFCSYTFTYWEREWRPDDLDTTYNDYISFISTLTDRCTTTFATSKYRIAIPQELRQYMARTRALSFKQKRTGDMELQNIVKQRRKYAKSELKRFLANKLSSTMSTRNTPSHQSLSFWSNIKRAMKSSASSLQGFTLNSTSVTNDPETMCAMAADHYEESFKAPSNVTRPHPYTDAPEIAWDNVNEEILPTTTDEVLQIVNSCKKKRSCDAHGISSHMFDYLPSCYWSLFTEIFNQTLSKAIFPRLWKDTRVLLLAKKDPICLPAQTRPISLLDSFLKINEKIFLVRFRNVLERRGILPDTQSGFRAGFRLQTRVLLFLDQVASLMSNSVPVATVFVDFKSAFDQLWYAGCIGKLGQMGIPKPYRNWILTWLQGRRAYIEINGAKSRWFNMGRGCPQGSVLSPTLFITYHADMGSFLGGCLSHFFADDLAAILAGNIGKKFTDQCLDLEQKLTVFFTRLEYYAALTLQPINYQKTEALWSARAIGAPKFQITTEACEVKWAKEFKYLGYWITPKLGFGNMISKTVLKIRQRIGMIKSVRVYGCSSPDLRRMLFSSYVLPLFTWLFPLFPMLTERQQTFLNHFYYTCLKRIYRCSLWSDHLFAFFTGEISLDDRCLRYWDTYIAGLTDSMDGNLLYEEAILNTHRETWLKYENNITGLYRSKRFVNHISILQKSLQWCSNNSTNESVPFLTPEEVLTLADFPESF